MTYVMRQRLKLVALLGLLFAPLPLAWAMLNAQVGIPDGRVANGALLPAVAPLPEWSLRYIGEEQDASLVETGMPPQIARGADEERFWLSWPESEDSRQAEVQAERWWRLHRALGKEAPRLGRLVVAAQEFQHAQVPGEQRALGEWPVADLHSAATPESDATLPESLRLIDPQGRVVLAYGADVTPKAVLTDVRRLLKRNPAAPR
ncbi:hypothetical protein [Cobetia crustatorum]|uniref:Uncharacterized protein n=1 Tax=Cobetia crustatorum TaxID=553385 RepID=A0A558HX69_9GAMM|nr:hypothetical protein [Cobetia crustatorum]TVU73689.1 hypothetical protein FQP86_01030 [Cobetia crustatorum]